MNKHHIPVKVLREMITGFRKVVPRNSETLRELKIDLARGTITATDGSAFLSYQLGRPSAEGRSYLLSFDGLSHFAKGLPTSQEILLEAEADLATLTTVDRKCFAKLMKPDDPYGTPPSFLGKDQSVTPDDRAAILRACSCAGTDDSRYLLQGVYLDNGGSSSQVIGTDGRCLYHELLQSLEIQKPFILPTSSLLKWRGFGDDWRLKVDHRKEKPAMIQLTAGPWRFTVPAVEGNYPNWRQVIPEVRSRLSRLTLGKDDIATLRGLKGDSIGFLSNADEVRFVTFDKEANKWITHLTKDSSLKGPPSRVFLDPKFLARALDADLTEVCMADECDAILFRGKGQLVVMPRRVAGPAIPGQETEARQQEPKNPVAPAPPKPMENNTPNPNPTTPAHDAALESLRTLKGQLRESIGLVDESLRHLREMQVDHRATKKDMNTIRGTLQSLKNVAFAN